MIQPRALPLPSLLVFALAMGLSACGPSAPAATETVAAPTMDARRDAAQASTGEHLAAAADAINPMTSPREAVIASMHKLVAASSYHISMQMSGGPSGATSNDVDFVAPDRFRMEMSGVGTQIIVGDTMYMSMDGRKMKMPMPAGTTKQWRDPGNFSEAEASMTAEAMGSESVDGVSAQKYRVHYTLPVPTNSILLIGPDGLPLQMRMTIDSKGTPITVTQRYSRINDRSIHIDAPK